MTIPSTGLRKAVTMPYAVALYMSSVLGSGVLVLPGLAAQIAGPASLIAWLLLSLVSYPLAYTFASLSARKPESGGVYSFTRESFGVRYANMVGWLFTVWYITGAPVVTVNCSLLSRLCNSLRPHGDLSYRGSFDSGSFPSELCWNYRKQQGSVGGHYPHCSATDGNGCFLCAPGSLRQISHPSFPMG